MIVPLHVPGEWYAVVADGRVALLAPQTPAPVVTEVWDAVRRGSGLTAPLQVLLGAGLEGLPPFALVSLEGGRAHVIVRGEPTVHVGDRVVAGTERATWTEEVVPGAADVAVRAPGAGPVEDGLPVLAAVVRASAVEVRVRADVPAPAVPPETVADQPHDAPDLEHTLHGLDREVLPPAPLPAPAPAPAPAPPAPAPEAPTRDEDHDGLTVLSSDVVALRRQLPGWAGDAVPGPLAVPTGTTPPPAKIQLSTGLVVSLNRPVLLGRAPQVSRVPASELPRLVTLASPNQDISRTHCEVRMDGEDVLVTDLRSTNGVLLLRQGQGPQRLHPGAPTVVEPGVVVDLGDGVTFIVEKGT